MRGPTVKRIGASMMLSLAFLFSGSSPALVHANVFGQLGKLYGCVVTWGILCDLSETVVGTGQSPKPIPVTCAPPLMTGLPQFLSWPKGSAKYRFQSTCSSPARANAAMTVRWEGSWTPSETKADRPNASETLEITGFEPFLPDREPGGKIFMYWTARCTRDPWLQSGGCTPWGAYVPDDLREALPDIDRQSFPRTANVIAPADKRRLYAEYLKINPPGYFAQLGLLDRGSAPSRQGKYFMAPPIAVDQPKASTGQMVQSPQGSATDRLGAAVQQQSNVGTPPPYAPDVPIQKKPSSPSIFSRGVESEGMSVEEIESAESPPAVTLDRPLHFRSMEGEDIVVEAGIYEIESVIDLQLSLAREGQTSLLLPAMVGTHQESLKQPVALVAPGDSNDIRHLLLLTPDGTRFEAQGSISGVKDRGTGAIMPYPSSKIRDAMTAYSVQPESGSPPPCQPNPLPVGPRWIPPGCKMPSVPIPNIPGPAPAPYLDGSNQLYACVNNYTGAFRLIRPADGCLPDNNEVKVKWQIAP